MAKNQNLTLTIEKIGRKSDGVSNTLDGRKIFVPGTVPGDVVNVKIRNKRKRDDVFYGDIKEIIKPGESRIEPPCSHYSKCGSCSLQHMEREAYQKWKISIVEEILGRANIAPEEMLLPVFIPEGTRRRATFTVFKQNRSLRIGYRRQRSHDITDIKECMVLSPAISDFVTNTRPHLLRILTDSRPANIFVQESEGVLDVLYSGPIGKKHEPGLAEREAIAEMVHELSLARFSWREKERSQPETIVSRVPFIKKSGPLFVELPAGAFLQPSETGEQTLSSAVMNALPDQPNLKMADLFAGCGTFSGRMLDKGYVTAFENDELATGCLNVAGQQQSRFKVITRDLFKDPLEGKELDAFGAVVMDPPRAGAKHQVANIAASSLPLLVYVSCNPASFARDAAVLIEGGYHFTKLAIIDQFIFSAHVEIVGVFTR